MDTITSDVFPVSPSGGADTRSPFALGLPLRLGLAVLSSGAAMIHVSMVSAHAREWVPLGIGFALAGWFQLVFAVAIMARPSRGWLRLNIAVTLAILGTWAVARIWGFPVGPLAGEVEAVVLVDALCATLEALLVLGSVLALVRPQLAARVPAPAFVGAVALPAIMIVALTTAVLASPAGSHGHTAAGHRDAADDHDAGDPHAPDQHAPDQHAPDQHAPDQHAAGDHHDEFAATTDTTAAHDHPGAQDPLVAGATGVPAGATQAPEPPGHADHDAAADGVGAGSQAHEHGGCTAPVTPAQQQAADDLVNRTTAAVAKYRDFNAALADGYTPITPADRPVVHYGNIPSMTDGRILDEQHVESLMYAFDKNRTPYFIGAMYLNDAPAVTPPSPGGCLMQWHDHTNLCIAPGRGMVGVVGPDGSCPAGSSNEVTSQMMHVYTIELPGGPLSHEAAPADIRAGVVKQALGR